MELAACQYLQAYKENIDKLFTLVHGEPTRDDGHKLKPDRFRLDIRRIFFSSQDRQVVEEVAQRG